MFDFLDRGKWERPTDKMAVYTELSPEKRWGIRITFLVDTARVEAINGPKCSWYQAPERVSSVVKPPTFFEKLRGVTFADKLKIEVEKKRAVAEEENMRGIY